MTFHFGSMSGFMHVNLGRVPDSSDLDHMLQTQLGKRIYANCDMKHGCSRYSGGALASMMSCAHVLFFTAPKSRSHRWSLLVVAALEHTMADDFAALFCQGRCPIMQMVEERAPVSPGPVAHWMRPCWLSDPRGLKPSSFWRFESSLVRANSPKQICWRLLTK